MGGSSDLQRFEAHDPLALNGRGDPMVAGHCFRLVKKDMGASAKRKENQSSSSSRKKVKTSVSYGFKDGATTIRAKAKSGLLTRRGR